MGSGGKTREDPFEIGGVDRETAMEALRLASHKLPIKTRIVERSIE